MEHAIVQVVGTVIGSTVGSLIGAFMGFKGIPWLDEHIFGGRIERLANKLF